MSLKSNFRLLLLMLFALLQCIAPLAHAHVNGHHSADELVIVDYVDARHSHNHNIGVFHMSVAEEHSAVVSMQPEYRLKEFVIAQTVVADLQISLLLQESSIMAWPPAGRQFFSVPPYQHPCSQAPPV